MTAQQGEPNPSREQQPRVVGYTEDHGLSPEQLQQRIEAALSEDWSPLPDDDVIERLGRLIDAAADLGNAEATRTAIARADALLERPLTAADRATVHYFAANAWAAVRDPAGTGAGGHAWDRPEIAQQIVHLRHALHGGVDAGADGSSGAPRDVARLRHCQIATNLGNLMSASGRLVDAVAYWDAALAVDPTFPMALGNRGYGLLQYARLVHDPGHQAWHLRDAFAGLVRATDPAHAWRLHPGAREFFGQLRDWISAHVPSAVLERPAHAHRFPKRMPRHERVYREWCLRHRLFLNDLNDLGVDPLAAADVLVLPNLTTCFDAGQPNAFGFFNQLKQEYVSARYLYYDGSTRERPHWSDREVTLLNTLDYPAYGLAVEQVKAAFRIAYSIFDKIAFFLNDYFALNIPERQVSFRGLWYERQDPARGLRTDVHRPENAPLKGLFWLAKDLYEREAGYVEALEPAAREIAAVRNHLEHKYLKLHLFGPPPAPQPGQVRLRGDALAYSLDRAAFEQRTRWLLTTARAALIYVSLAVHVEEHRRKHAAGDTVVVPMPTDVWDDRWKF